MNAKERRVLSIAVIIAVLFGIYFLRPFFTAIAFAAISAYLFNPIYNWWAKRLKRHGAPSLTLLTTAVIFLIPIILIVVFTAIQIQHLINSVQSINSVDLGHLGKDVLDWVNNVLSHIPGAKPITSAQLSDAVHNVVTAVAKGLFNIISGSVGSIASFFTSLIIFIYIFLNLLTHKKKVLEVYRGLNPLGPKLTNEYLEKAAALTTAMVKGQFVIAICQGLVGALILQIAGIHGLFFFLFLLLTILSIIPLGGGIIVIPIGIIMLLLGGIWQGIFVLAGHFLVVTNIDNVLRPYLVPKSVSLNPALTLLGVFSGLAMFGFLGIVIGPVVMIILKLTIEAYLEVRQQTAKG